MGNLAQTNRSIIIPTHLKNCNLNNDLILLTAKKVTLKGDTTNFIAYENANILANSPATFQLEPKTIENSSGPKNSKIISGQRKIIDKYLPVFKTIGRTGLF